MIGKERRVSAQKGITMNVNVLRSESTGSVHIKSADPAEPPAIRFNFLSTEHDRTGIVTALRKGRELMATSPLKEITGKEIAPGAHLQSDAELLEWVRNNAETTYHPVGTCKMGNDPRAVVDPELRVHGIDRPARRRRLDHADAHVRQHQRAHHHDRREVRRDGAGRGGCGASCLIKCRAIRLRARCPSCGSTAAGLRVQSCSCSRGLRTSPARRCRT